MSIKAMVTVWQHSKQRGSGLLLMLAVADYMNEYGEAWPSIDSLARKTRCHRSTVIDLSKRCVEDGELTINDGAGSHGTNVYRLGPHYYKVWESEIPTSEIPTPMDTGDHRDPGGPVSGGGRNPGVGIRLPESDPILQEPDSSSPQERIMVLEGSGRKSLPQKRPGADQTPWVQALASIRIDRFRNRTPGDNFARYFQPTVSLGLADGVFRVACQDEDQRAWLQSNGRRLAENALVGVLGMRVRVEFVVEAGHDA